ncbi:MAG: metallophosphoesterase [Prosthecobacter sp.]
MKEKEQAYDVIGDIHGQHGKLSALLAHLGYQRREDTHRHPAGRKVLFLGDYIDRGPAVREVLHTVRGMVEAGDALAIMGNHEYNAVCADTPDGSGSFLRVEKRDSAGHLETHRQFAGRASEWAEWTEWMKRLPMFLDLGGLRAVHACWDAKRITRISGRSITDAEFLRLSATHQTPEFRAVTNILKGPELAMPAGQVAIDKEGKHRRMVRVRWWDIPKSGPISRLAMPEPFDAPGDAVPHELRRIPSYGPDEPPVFFGHYWLPPQRARAPLAPNIACLDYSAAFADHPLTAYRWDGERVLSADKFATATR